MKCLHIHVAVDNLAESTRFYSALFAAEPARPGKAAAGGCC
jgi:hypothetical protein